MNLIFKLHNALSQIRYKSDFELLIVVTIHNSAADKYELAAVDLSISFNMISNFPCK